jgi:S1-C subfamily serine protease
LAFAELNFANLTHRSREGNRSANRSALSERAARGTQARREAVGEARRRPRAQRLRMVRRVGGAVPSRQKAVAAVHGGEPREAMVAHVEYPSPAFDAGLHVGDLLLAVNGLPIAQIDRQDLSKLLTPSGAAKVVLEVSRLNKKKSFTLTPVTYRAALAIIGRKPTRFGTTPKSCPDI